ncbi:hypothetical protein [Streptomyces cupreus]|nr:hypothetical protein [Streptomyces cupreus]
MTVDCGGRTRAQLTRPDAEAGFTQVAWESTGYRRPVFTVRR